MARTSKALTLRIGRRSFPVKSLEEASTIYCHERDASGKEAALFPVGRIGRTHYVSYNGNVWTGKPQDWRPGTVPVVRVAGVFASDKAKTEEPEETEEKEDVAIPMLLVAFGFNLEQTGGNCTAYVRRDKSGDIEETITDGVDPRHPTRFSDLVSVGAQDMTNPDDDGSEGIVEGYTLAQVLEALEHPSDEYALLTLRLENLIKRPAMSRAAADAATEVLEAGGSDDEMQRAAADAAWEVLEGGV